MRITETFLSIQGEGRRMGVPTAFVRTTGCHLRCTWCDAKYTFTGGAERPLDELVAWVRQQPTTEVCFTGGEPLLQKEAWPFLERLLQDGRTVVVETAGNLGFGQANLLPPELRARLCISMDVKCPGSGMSHTNDLRNLEDLRAPDQLKFVIADRADYDFARDIVRRHGPFPCPVYFNPVGGTDAKLVTEWLLAETEPLPARVGVQLHKLIWGDVPGR